MNKYLVGAILILALVVVFAEQAWSSPPMQQPCIERQLELIQGPDESGQIVMLLTFGLMQGIECDSVLVQISPARRMTYSGPSRFYAQIPDSGLYSTTLFAKAAPNDTSAILVGLSCHNCGGSVACVLVTTENQVKVLDYIPTPRGPEPPREQRVIDYRNGVQQPSSTDVAYPKSADTVEFGRQPTAEERRLQMRESRVRQMHEMETEPLTELEAQVFTVDSVDYIRYRGETKFHVVVPIKDPWEHSRHVADSIAALPPEQECDIVLHLPEDSQLKLARDLTDSLIPATRPGFYITRTTRAVIKQLSDAGIGIGFLDQMPEGTFSPAKME